MVDGSAEQSRDTGREPPTTGTSDVGGSFSVESLWEAVEGIPAGEAPDPLLGRSLGDVTLTRFIAEGGMGRVYEAEQSHPARRVAVKLLRPGLFARETIRRFVREVSTLGRLQHPWITQVFSAGTYEIAGVELPYFVMELIPEALPITEYVTSRHLPLTERIGLFRQVCDAIAYGHERGIVHRDLKPSNLLVDGLGHPKVIDFGVARCAGVDEQITALTEVGRVIGTLQYMSPEQVSGQSAEVDARADVYSLGVVLYEVLAGRPPHMVRGLPLAHAARVIHEQRPPPLRAINPMVPRRVALVADRCLNKDREQRFQTAGELSAALAHAELGDPEPLSPSAVRRRVMAALVRPAVAGFFSAGVVLCGMYLMPPVPWPSPFGVDRFEALQPTTRSMTGFTGVRPPNAEAMADTAASAVRQPLQPYRNGNMFRFALQHIYQKDADAFLVQNIGMKKWSDQFMFPRVSYWAPLTNDQQGVLIYRFPFGGKAKSISMRAIANCWDFFREPGGVGRGAAAIEISRDGERWVVLEDHIEPRQWGVSITVDRNLPDEFVGSETLWVRVRCTTESAPVVNGYNVAQFARARHGQPDAVFEVKATLEESATTSGTE